MAYVVPIHRPSSVRHAIKLKLLDPEEECLVIAKANRIEVWIESQDGLTLTYTRSIYGRIAMLQKLRPANSTTDHLFIGTGRYQYFTAVWNPQTRQLDTVQSFVDASEKHMRDSQSLDRCSVDPTGQHLVLELFEGVLNILKITRPKKGTSDYLTDAEQVRISELYIRSSTFLRSSTKIPKFAILYQDRKDKVKLATYRLCNERGEISSFDPAKDRENDVGDLDPGANLLIPVPEAAEEQKRYIVRGSGSRKAQLGGVLVVGETTMLYLDDESKATVEYAYDEAAIFVAWAQYDERNFILADDFGALHILNLQLEGPNVVGMAMHIIGHTTRPTQLVYMGDNVLFVASHEGDSQVLSLHLVDNQIEELQSMSNIAPILDFTIMDMGNRGNDALANEYSSGQARIVAGSGVFKSGTLRSVRSGVGLDDIGLLGEMKNIKAMFSLKSSAPFGFVDTLVISFLTETRVLVFDSEGEVEEKEEFLGLKLTEQTLLARNVSGSQILQVTSTSVLAIEADSGMVLSSWKPLSGEKITAASCNEKYLLISVEGKSLVSLNIESGLSEVACQDLGDSDQVSCVHVPAHSTDIGLAGFWHSGSVSTLDITTLKVIHGETVRTADSAAVPRNIVLTQVLPESLSGPTLFVAMSDGIVLTYNVDRVDHSLSGKKSVVLGTQHANLQILPQLDGTNNVFATCEHSSLIYGSEGRITYAAVTAEDATSVCSFDAESYRDSIVLATKDDIRISQIDTERRTHVTTLDVGETVRRIAYSPTEKVFGLGTISRKLENGNEIITSSFRFVDEVVFGDLGKPFQLDCLESSGRTELVETVIRAQLPDSYGERTEKFIVGTSFLEHDTDEPMRGRILVFGIDDNRSPYLISNLKLKGACRCLAVMNGKIVAGLTKTVGLFSYTEDTTTSATLEKIATYRTATYPVALAVSGSVIAVGDLMKSVSICEYQPGKDGEPDELVELARHFQTFWTTAVSNIEGDSYLASDGDGNLLVLRHNKDGVTLEDRQRLQVTSEISLGEMVNKISRITVESSPNSPVIPRAFLATTEGSIYLFATISSSAQDVLMRLQSQMAELVQSPGHLPFDKYRAFKNVDREGDEPFRFVDGELVERFLDVNESLQEEICNGLGPSVEDIRNMVEELKRLH